MNMKTPVPGVLAVGALALAACGGSSQIQVKGEVIGGSQAQVTVMHAFGRPAVCSGVAAGGQVIIKGPDGTLLATTTLHRDKAALHVPAALSTIGQYDFASTVPDGPGPFTVDLVGVSSLVVSKAQLGQLRLSCGG